MMRWLKGLCGFLVLVSIAAGSPVAAAPRGEVLVLTVDGPITPVVARYLERGLREALARESEAVIVQLNTPGGTLDAMQDIVESLRNSPVPVVVYVSPRGARAASAGTLVLLAAHVAAMAPETTLGAAAPVGPQGEDLGETLKAKAINLLQAMARSLARHRGEKAVDVAQRLIAEAYALPAEEALDIGLIDLVAEDLDDLLVQLDGYPVQTVAGSQVLATAQAQPVALNPTFLEEALLILTNPNVVFLLLILGVQFLLAEIANPGGWVAGFLGVVMLALALYGLGTLPVNWLGLLLILAAFVLIALEVKTPGFQGGLALAGATSLIVGALLLFNTPMALPFQRVSVPLVVLTGLFVTAISLGVLLLAVRAQRRPVVMGPERLQQDLVGRRAFVRTRITPIHPGAVQVAGELWTAECPADVKEIPPESWVEVIAVQGGHLIVRPSDKERLPETPETR